MTPADRESATALVQRIELDGEWHVESWVRHDSVGLIVGDESGRKPRPADPAWVATARDAAQRHGIAFHFKQWAGAAHPRIGGERVKGKIHLPILDGEKHDAVPEVPRG